MDSKRVPISSNYRRNPIFPCLVRVYARKSPHAQEEKVNSKVRLGIDHSKSLFGMHIGALLRKRLLTFKRDKKMWAFNVVMPAIFVLIGIIILESITSSNQPSLLLTPTVNTTESACACARPSCA